MFRGVNNWYPRNEFVLPMMLVRAELHMRNHQIQRRKLSGEPDDRRCCVLTADVTRGTNCTRSRIFLDKGLHVDHNEPTTSDGWPGYIPQPSKPLKRKARP